MNDELLPFGTERFLNRLGYYRDGSRWAPRPEIGLSPNFGDRVMGVEQVKYRRLQAIFMHRGF